MIYHALRILALIISTAGMTGCNTTLSTKSTLTTFNSEISSGNYQSAAMSAINAGSIDGTGISKDLLWSLQAGSALTASGEFQKAFTIFDFAETLMKTEDTESIGRKGAEVVTSTFLNNTFNRYNPTVYDGVMVNTYKGLGSIFSGELSDARIEFNRAADRQRRAEEFFKSKIDKQKLEQEEKKDISDIDLDKSKTESSKAIYEVYPELSEWSVYPDFVNPFTDYLHGLYFLLASQNSDDFGKARQSFRRVAGMNTTNSAVKTDLKVINNLRTGAWKKENLSPAVWVIFENGEAPEVTEQVIPIPLFLISSNKVPSYAQIALPKLKMRKQAYPYLDIYSNSENIARTELLASLDRVVQTEFKKEFPYKIAQATISAITKAVIQNEAEKKGGLYGGLGAVLFQAATTRADTRSWTALPKEVQVSRIRKPSDGKLEIRAPGLLTPLNIELPKERFTIVYVKASGPNSMPVYHVVGFDA